MHQQKEQQQQQQHTAQTPSSHSVTLQQTRKKVRFAEADDAADLRLLCDESALDQHQLLVDSVSALSDKELGELLRDIKTESAIKPEPLSPDPVPLAATPPQPLQQSSSSALIVAPRRPLEQQQQQQQQHQQQQPTVQFEFNRLPAVARRRILMLLKNEAPHAPCVCWLWSQLLNDDAHETCEYLVTRERRLQAAYARSVRQPEIKREMLPMLIDWLVDVSEEFELLPVTFHTAVVYLRWHLAHNQVRKTELQLLGATCLFVAAKYHEKDSDVPTVLDFVYMGDSAYTQQAMLNAEVKLVHSLDFELQPTTALSFLHLYCDALQVRPHTDAQVFWMAMHLLELSLLRTSTMRLRPSVAAAAALHIAIATRIGSALAIDVWDGSLYMLTGLTPSRAPMSNAVVSFYQLRINPPTVPGHPLGAIHAKFLLPTYASVAAVPLPLTAPIP
jgi:cyclin A